MPKNKTKKIVHKRFKITKTGRVLHRTQGKRHIRRTKTKSHQRRQDRMREVTNTKYAKMVKHFLH